MATVQEDLKFKIDLTKMPVFQGFDPAGSSGPKVTVARVLKEARAHVQAAWTKGVEVRSQKSDKEMNIGYLAPTKVKATLFDLGMAKDELAVCSLGGIFLARAIINGGDTPINQDPITQKATALLAIAINPDVATPRAYKKPCVGPCSACDFEAQRFDAEEPSVESPVYSDTVVRFNDAPDTTQEQVLEAFDKAISLATVFGL